MYVEGDFEAGPTLVGPEGATTINIAGVGFGILFNPLARNQMKCEFNGQFPLFGCRARCGMPDRKLPSLYHAARMRFFW